MDKKTDLRVKAKALRKSLDMAKISEDLCNQIRESDVYKVSKYIMLFYPKANEVDLRHLLKDEKTFYLPRVCGDDLEVCEYKAGDSLIKSGFGVLEPITKPADPKVIDLVIVPALAVDKKGYRLGYGGGYYDRFLEKFPDIKTLCAIPKELVIAELPKDDFDKKINYIITA